MGTRGPVTDSPPPPTYDTYPYPTPTSLVTTSTGEVQVRGGNYGYAHIDAATWCFIVAGAAAFAFFVLLFAWRVMLEDQPR